MKGAQMRYQNIVLVATGGGAVLVGVIGLLSEWWIGAIVAIMLILLVVGFVRLLKGEKRLKWLGRGVRNKEKKYLPHIRVKQG